MKLLVVGSQGMAGHVIEKYLKRQGYNISTVARKNADYILDIENTRECQIFFEETKNEYDFVINCIGLLVKDSIENPSRAILINSWFPHFLEQITQNTKTKIIHLSTDCVFDGKKGNYVEDDVHTETNFYGRSKSLGEINNNKDITFRMSIIGPELKTNGTGLLNWITTSLDLELNGWENAYWNGMTTLQLAKCIEKYLENPNIAGIYNLVNNDLFTNKYELLCKINSIYELGKTIRKTYGPKNINKILVDTRQSIGFEIPDYDIQIKEMKNFI